MFVPMPNCVVPNYHAAKTRRLVGGDSDSLENPGLQASNDVQSAKIPAQLAPQSTIRPWARTYGSLVTETETMWS